VSLVGGLEGNCYLQWVGSKTVDMYRRDVLILRAHIYEKI
jgi:hypothetical protein